MVKADQLGGQPVGAGGGFFLVGCGHGEGNQTTRPSAKPTVQPVAGTDGVGVGVGVGASIRLTCSARPQASSSSPEQTKATAPLALAPVAIGANLRFRRKITGGWLVKL
jgi:hypothetical protein